MTLETGNLTASAGGMPGVWQSKDEYSTTLTLSGSTGEKSTIILKEGSESYNIVNDGADHQLKFFRTGLVDAESNEFTKPVLALDASGQAATTLSLNSPGNARLSATAVPGYNASLALGVGDDAWEIVNDGQTDILNVKRSSSWLNVLSLDGSGKTTSLTLRSACMDEVR